MADLSLRPSIAAAGARDRERRIGVGLSAHRVVKERKPGASAHGSLLL
jgi:hypothetical protein